MSIWFPDHISKDIPRYIAIADALMRDIADGKVGIGTKLPPQRDLAWKLKVTVGTVARAYSEAAKRGLVSGEVGRGTYVLDKTEPHDGLTVLHRTLAEIHQRPADEDGFIDMSINRPTGDNAAPLIASALKRVADSPNLSRLLGYRIDSPWPHHAAAAAKHLAAEGVNVTPSNVAITVGAQQGIVAVMAALTRPGDVILTEELTYPGIKRTATLIDRTIEAVAMDEGGLSPQALDAALARHPGGLIYCMPALQNPTTITMNLERRKAIVTVARRHRATIVEDGIYAFLAKDGPPPIWSMAPDICVYLTSISKTLSPGLRVGFVVAPEEARARIAATIAATTMMVPPVMAEVATMLIEDGSAARTAEAQRIEATKRVELTRAVLGARHCPPTPSDNIWLMLPPEWRADDFAAEASRRGVLVTPARAFAAGPRVPKAVRVSISAPRDLDQLRAGLEILARILADSPDRLAMTV